MNKRLFGIDRVRAGAGVRACRACGGGGGGGVSPIAPAPHADANADADAHADADADPDTDADADARHQLRHGGISARRPTPSLPTRSPPTTPARPGTGVKIGIVDSGINPSLAEFAGRIDPASGDVAGNRGVSDEDGHGTAVSAVAAAARNGQNTMGVAFNATIVSERADDPGSLRAARTAASSTTRRLPAGIDAARQAGAKVINLSLGGSHAGHGCCSARCSAR